jgi:hypothetical protein
MLENNEVPRHPGKSIPLGADVSAGATVSGGLEIHPFATLFPEMAAREFDAFAANIRAHGQLEPIWTYQGKVIDGRNRLRACIALGLTPKTREWDGAGSLLEFVIGLNLHRRHLKERQRAMLAARLRPQFEQEARIREHLGKESDPCANLHKGPSSHHAGKLLSVSERSVNHACKVLEKGIPGVIAAVDACKLAVSTAADLAEFPPDEQARLLTLSRRELSAALQPLRDARKHSTPQAQQDDDTLLAQFRAGNAMLRKTGRVLTLEFSDDFVTEFRAAADNPAALQCLLERGVVMTKKKAAAA